MSAMPMTLASSMTSIAPAIDHGHRFSSVINEDDVSSEKLTLYINWLARKNPILTEQLTQCLKKLKKVYIIFNTLFEVPDSLFDSWDYEVEIAKSRMKKYEHARVKERA